MLRNAHETRSTDVDMDVYEESEFAVIPDIEDSPIQARRRREAYLQAWSACEASIHVRALLK